MREKTVAMLRIRNEERWIARCLQSLWPVAQTVVVFDDGSTDNTLHRALTTVLGQEGANEALAFSYARSVDVWKSEGKILHYIRTSFGEVRPSERVNEFRDKEFLWHYLKTNVDFDTVICLDGDEALSQTAIRDFGLARDLLDRADILEVPVVYLWDSEKQIRVDGVYRKAGDGQAQLRHPRIFTIRRLTEDQLFQTRFRWTGSNGGFHIGSVPTEGFPGGTRRMLFPHPIVHYGYLDEETRQRKFEFYTRLDPNGQSYLHIIGKPNREAPGPVKLRPWIDS